MRRSFWGKGPTTNPVLLRPRDQFRPPLRWWRSFALSWVRLGKGPVGKGGRGAALRQDRGKEATMRTYPDGQRTENGSSNGRRGPLLIVSNRGPVEYRMDDSGGIHSRRAGGGLATALASAAKSRPVTWIASAVTSADRKVAAGGAPVESKEGWRLRLVAPSAVAYKLFYGTFCNPILWFLQHSLWHRLSCPDLEASILHSWEQGYLPVNQAFGQAVAEELMASDGVGQVTLHDYHLYAAPLFIRNRAPQAALQHFIHIPWPQPEEWRALPRAITESICEGLLANDSVVFQTQEYAENFLHTCEDFLPGIRLSSGEDEIIHQGRHTRVWANPISVDVKDLVGRLASPKANEYREKLGAEMAERTIVRVDRLDPSKNAVTGFRAFEMLLERHPEWLGRVKFLAFLVPSRTGVAEYQDYTDEVFGLVDGINKRYGQPGWTPITVFHEHNRLQALVAMSLCDVLLVNPHRDGMNLVAKEGPVVNERDGVLVLSTTAGAYAELREGALGVRPDDIVGTAEALNTALSMPDDERRERAAVVRQAILDHDLDDWLNRQLDDLEAIQEEGLVTGARA